MRERTLAVTIFLLATGWWAASPASADPIFQGGPLGRLEATAAFSMVGDDLQVVLTNTSAFDVTRRNQILTALFFDSAGTLTPLSATLTDTSTALFDTPPVDGNVGGEWAYATGAARGGATRGIGAATLGGYFSSANFNGPELEGRADGSVGRINYGLTSEADDPTTGKPAVSGSNALIQSSVTFLLSVGPDFTLDSIGHVLFQYGARRVAPSLLGVRMDANNALSEMVFRAENNGTPTPEVPEPATLSLFGLGLAAVARRLRKQLRLNQN